MEERHRVGGSEIGRMPLARLALLLVVGGLALQIAFNLLMARLGFGYPYTLFLFRPDDRWADFFKLAFAYTDARPHPPLFHWPFQPLLDSHLAQADEFRGSRINPDHLPPLATLLAVLARRAVNLTDPVLPFLACLLAGAAGLAATIRGLAGGWRGGILWTLTALASYPLWFLADRGHFFSLICGLTLMAGCARYLARGRMDPRTLLLLAIACNLRPNAVVVPVLLAVSRRDVRWSDLVRLSFAGLALLLATMGAAHVLYPHYGFGTWIAGLRDYQLLYVEHPLSLGFVSSLPSALTLLLGPNRLMPEACMMLAALLAMRAVMAARDGRLEPPHLLFIALALMPVMTPAFSDYHLLPFLLPPMMLAHKAEPLRGRADRIVFFTSIALLVPKNYLYGSADPANPWSWQVVLNPAILLGASLYLLSLASRRASAPR